MSEKEWKGFYQQGDVLLHKCSIPGGATFRSKKKKGEPLVLVEGEVTGHAHRIVEGEVELMERGGTMYLRVLSPTAKLSHEEHDLRETVRNFGSVENLSKDVLNYLETLDLDLTKPFKEIVEAVPRETIIEEGEYEIGVVKQIDHITQKTEYVRD